MWWDSRYILPGIPRAEGTAKDSRLLMATRVMEARMAGLRTGRVILQSVLRLELPHTFEDSSRETSKEDMAGAMIRYETGRSSSPSTRIMPGREKMVKGGARKLRICFVG